MIVYASTATYYALLGARLPKWMVRTAYLLEAGACRGSCRYCGISRVNSAGDPLTRVRIARVYWHRIKIDEHVEKLKMFERTCLQTVLSPPGFSRTLKIVKMVSDYARSISVNVGLVGRLVLQQLVKSGVDHLGVSIDAASPVIAARYGRPYDWGLQLRLVEEAVRLFGKGNVTVHLIVGLGEDAKTLASFMDVVYRRGARIALFPYTPLGKGSAPSLDYYRGAQVYRQLMEEGEDPKRYLEPLDVPNWRAKRRPDYETVRRALMTSGCPSCNRPFYTESPRGPIYNYPFRPPDEEVDATLRLLGWSR